MKNLAYIFVMMLFGTLAFAQNYNGVPILGTFTTPDPNFACTTETGNLGGQRLNRNAVIGQCPTKPCPGDFPGGTGWISYTFQNLLNSDQCIEIQHNTGTCSVPHGLVILGESYTGAPHCTNPDYMFLSDVGSSVSQSYFAEIPAGEVFTVVLQEVNPTGTCNVGFTIIGDVGCAGGETLKPLSGGTSVPTMTQWGLFLFGLIVLTLGVVYVYNMSVRTANVEE